MNRWKRFLKLRRQNDAVKLILIIFLAGVISLISVCYYGVKLYDMTAEQAEYVLTVPGASDGSDVAFRYRKLLELSESGEEDELKSDAILAVSLQQQKSVTIQYRGEDIPLSYMELSDAYLDEVYGIRNTGSMKTFYLNQKAWAALGGKESELLVNCLSNEEQAGNSGLHKTVKLILVTDLGKEEEPFICSRAEKGSLERNADSIRICFARRGIEEARINALRSQGFDFANTEELMRAEHARELLVLKMKYAALFGGFCLFTVGILRKYAII